MQDSFIILPTKQPVESEQALDFLNAGYQNLPTCLTSLIGREHEIQMICTLLRCREVRLLTLTGPGGVGKTRLGLQVATKLLTDYVDGCCFVPLASISDPDQMLSAIAQRLGLGESANRWDLECLKTYLREKQLLLLLDNFEQVTVSASLLTELLESCLNLKILVTSRAMLRVHGEYEFPVSPLAVPNLKQLPDLEALSYYPAIRLFLQRAQAIKPDFQMTTDNARAIAEICVRLDGLPLALELAAARVKLFPPAALLARLEQRLQILTNGARNAPVRQQTLRSTIAWSYHLLDTQEQQLFRRLSVFVGGCTLEALESICSALGDETIQLLDRVASLIDKSLVQQTEQGSNEPRFRILETIREYGLESLSTCGELEATRHAHAVYYLALAEEAEPELAGSRQAMWLEGLEREHDNLRAALRWSVEAEEVETELRLVGALRWFWCRRSYLSEGGSWLKSVLERAKSIKPSPLLTKALTGASGLAWLQGDYQRARLLGEESVALCRKLGDKRELAYALAVLGLTIRSQGDLKKACSLTEESVVLFQQVKDTWGLALALVCQGNVACHLQEYTLACSLNEESLKLFRMLGDRWGQAWSLSNLGLAAFAQGDDALARHLFEEGVAVFREQMAKRDLALWLDYLGQVMQRERNPREASVLFEESLALHRELNHKEGMSSLHCTLGKLACGMGNYYQAVAHLEESLVLMRETGDRRGIACVLDSCAKLAAELRQAKLAERLLEVAARLREASDMPIADGKLTNYEYLVAAVRTQLKEQAFGSCGTEGRVMETEQVTTTVEVAKGAKYNTTMPSPATLKVHPSTYPAGLTTREVEVLRLVAQGLTDNQVAEMLFVSPRTINWHLSSIYSKLQVSSRSAATRFAIEQQIV